MSDLVRQGAAAVRAGDRAEARRLLGLAIREDPRSAQAWLWLSGAVETDRERLMCLRKVLEIDPGNEMAQNGIAGIHKRQESERKAQQAPARVTETKPPPTSQVPRELDHSRSLEQLSPAEASALEGFRQLVRQELAAGRNRGQVVERLTGRGFPRDAVEQFVVQIEQGPRQLRATRRPENPVPRQPPPSPWLTIWTSPRLTIRRIVNAHPRENVVLLAALSGLSVSLGNAFAGSRAELSLLIQLGIASVAGPITGIISLYVTGFILCFTGRWLGGKATPAEVRAAIAWAGVPQIEAAIFWIPEFVLLGMLTGTISAGLARDQIVTGLLVLAGLHAVIVLWTSVVFLKCLGEVHRFSAWRAMAASFLGGVILAMAGCFLVTGLTALITAVVELFL